MASRYYVSTIAADPLLAIAERDGLDRSALVRLLGVSDDAIKDADQSLPTERFFELWGHIARSLDDPGLPVRVAEAMRAEDYHLLGFAVMTSTSGREVITRLFRYMRLFTNSGTWGLEERDDIAVLHLSRPEFPLTLGHRLANESVFAQCIKVFRQMYGQGFLPRWVHFQHAAPINTQALETFLGVRPQFNAVDNALAIGAHVLSSMPATANVKLGEFITTQANNRLAKLCDVRLADKVRAEIARALPSGDPTLAAVAKHLRMGERTLRRRLASEGYTFRKLVDQVRSSRVLELLDAGASVKEMAFALGFAGPGAFGRWFKRKRIKRSQ